MARKSTGCPYQFANISSLDITILKIRIHFVPSPGVPNIFEAPGHIQKLFMF